MDLHLEPKWRIFHILTNELDINDIIFLLWLFVQKVSKKMVSDRFVRIIKRKLHGGLKI